MRWICWGLLGWGVLLGRAVQAQLCVPRQEMFDRQLVADDGGVLLLQTPLWQNLTSGSHGSGANMALRLLHLGPDGRPRHDSLRHLRWVEWRYHLTRQPDTALGHTRPLLVPDTAGGLRPGFLSQLTRFHVELDSLGSAEAQQRSPTSLQLLWDPAMATTGTPAATRWLLRRADQPAVFPAGFVRNPYPRRLLDQLFPYLRPTAPTFQQEANGRIRLLGKAVYLQAASPPQTTSQSQDDAPLAHWLVQGPGWQLPLDGCVDPAAPLVSVAPDGRLYVTVVHAQVQSCPPAPDVWAIAYCIDLRRGTVLWHTRL